MITIIETAKVDLGMWKLRCVNRIACIYVGFM